MDVRAKCLEDNSHRRFITTAHVVQEWIVDEHGNFLEERKTLEATHEPDPDNTWTCAICGAEAKVEPYKPNDNNLKGIQCPKCAQDKEFAIRAAATFIVEDGGTELDKQAEVEWEDDYAIRCMACKHEGRVHEFKA